MQRVLAVLFMLSLLATQVFAQAPVPAAGKGPEVTVYNSNMALVKENRTLNLNEGMNNVNIDNVAAAIDATSVHFKSLTAPASCVIKEQNYQFDLVSRQRLLEKYIGKTIQFERKEEGQTKLYSGTLISAQDQLVVQSPEGVFIVSPEYIKLPTLPEGFVTKPTLNWLLNCTQPGQHQIELSYITNNFGWNADYVAVLNTEDTLADFNGWVTLTNQSGVAYPNATLKLIAGDVRRVQPWMNQYGMGGGMMMAKSMDSSFSEKAFFEYHMYTLGHPITVRDNETKQVELLTAPGVPLKKRYFIDAQRQPRDGFNRVKAQVKVEFYNSEANNLGMPLPAGKVRVYKADTDGSMQFVGEDMIDHTPKDERMRLYLGDAFDIVAEANTIKETSLGGSAREVEYLIKVRNHKDTDITVTVLEHAWGDWTITKSTHAAEKINANDFEFTVPVAAGAEVEVGYTIRIR